MVELAERQEPRVPLRVLIVEDSEDEALLILRELKRGGYKPQYERVETPMVMKKALAQASGDRGASPSSTLASSALTFGFLPWTTHWPSTAVAPKAPCTTGNATVTAVSSINAMLEPKLVAAKTHGAVFGVQGDFASFERITPSSQGCFTMPAIGLIPFPHVADRPGLPGTASSSALPTVRSPEIEPKLS